MNSQPSGNPLALALAAGEPRAYAALYDRFARSMLRVAFAMLKNTHLAEDAVHDVFVNLARGRQRLAKVDDLEAYIFSTLRHVILAGIAKAARERRHLNQLAMTTAIDEQPATSSADDLTAALSLLPDEQREVIALKVDAGLTFSQISTVLGISANTAASRHRYAIEKLRDRLGGMT